MGQRPRHLDVYRSTRHFFGAELRHWRELRGLSQDRLGRLIHVSGDKISKVEKASRGPSADFAHACDQVLNTGGVLSRLIGLVEQERATDTGRADRHLLDAASQAWRHQGFQVEYDTQTLRLPAGQIFPASVLPIDVQPGRRSADGALTVHLGSQHAGRLVVVVDVQTPENDIYLVDPQAVQTLGDSMPITVPDAYRLDTFTAAIVWATATLDAGLLKDDALLAVVRNRLREYHHLAQSAVTREVADGLSPVSHLWLGSEFCSRHVMRHLGGGTPYFWAREQQGEEACPSLLFRHRLPFLRDAGLSGASRILCLPEQVAETAAHHERVLLFLTVALMAALGIDALVCTDPDYVHVEEFALVAGRVAIIANWLRGDGLWHADVIPHSPILRRLENLCVRAAARSILSGGAGERLLRLSAYLRLDWRWLRQRCLDISHVGVAGLITPRSRLLSGAALELACAFTGTVPF